MMICPNEVPQKTEILELSQAKKVVVTEQKAQGNELFSFDFSILCGNLHRKIELTAGGVQGPVHTPSFRI